MKHIFFIFGILFSTDVGNIPFILSSLESNISILSGEREEASVYSVDDIINYAAMKNQLDPALIKALIQIESSGKHEIISSAGAIGLTQLMPQTAAMLNVDPYNKFSNVMGGSYYLKKLVDSYGLHDGLIAYNCGPGNFERKNIPAESHSYAHKVMNLYEKLKSGTR